MKKRKVKVDGEEYEVELEKQEGVKVVLLETRQVVNGKKREGGKNRELFPLLYQAR